MVATLSRNRKLYSLPDEYKLNSQGVSDKLYGLFKMGCKWYDLSSIHKDAIQAGIIRVSKDMNEQEVSNIIYR